MISRGNLKEGPGGGDGGEKGAKRRGGEGVEGKGERGREEEGREKESLRYTRPSVLKEELLLGVALSSDGFTSVLVYQKYVVGIHTHN